MGFEVDEIEVYFIEGVFKISQMAEGFKREAERVGGEFGLVIIDTGPVFYEGDDENNRTQQGNHAKMLRDLIDIVPGKPTVIANCHPVKNASPDNLVPAGGGNFLNQVDGNLTAAKNESTCELHWQGKFRGADFAPLYFGIKTVTHERLKDSKGKRSLPSFPPGLQSRPRRRSTRQSMRSAQGAGDHRHQPDDQPVRPSQTNGLELQ